MKIPLLYLVLSIYSFSSFAQEQQHIKISRKDSLLIDSTWNVFKQAVFLKDKSKVIELSTDSVYCRLCVPMPTKRVMEKRGWIAEIPIKKFISEMNKSVFTEHIWKIINSKTYSVFAIEFIGWKPEYWNSLKYGNYIRYEISYVTAEQDEWGKGHEGQQYFFQFDKLGKKFMFSGILTMP
jgi:hypothetical protein